MQKKVSVSKKRKSVFLVFLLIFVMIFSGCEGAGTQSVKSELPEKSTITDKTLKDVFEEHGMKVGCCINSGVTGSQNTETIILDQFSSVTMENAMKPDSVLSKNESQRAGRIILRSREDITTI